jgi:hypothetical protein
MTDRPDSFGRCAAGGFQFPELDFLTLPPLQNQQRVLVGSTLSTRKSSVA